MFSFKNVPNLYQSIQLKTHAVNMLRNIGRVVVQLENMENIAPLLKRMGKQHVGREVVLEHYEVLGEVFVQTLEEWFK